MIRGTAHKPKMKKEGRTFEVIVNMSNEEFRMLYELSKHYRQDKRSIILHAIKRLYDATFK